MNEYEVGVYGLREAVQESERFKSLVAARDEEVKEKVRAINERERQLEDLKEEVRRRMDRRMDRRARTEWPPTCARMRSQVAWMRERLGIKDGEKTGVDLKSLRLKTQIEAERLKAQVREKEGRGASARAGEREAAPIRECTSGEMSGASRAGAPLRGGGLRP